MPCCLLENFKPFLDVFSLSNSWCLSRKVQQMTRYEESFLLQLWRNPPPFFSVIVIATKAQASIKKIKSCSYPPLAKNASGEIGEVGNALEKELAINFYDPKQTWLSEESFRYLCEEKKCRLLDHE